MDIKVFLPDSLLRSGACFILGRHVLRNNELILYMTEKSTNIQTLISRAKADSNLICARFGPCDKLPETLCRNEFDIEPTEYCITKLTINGEDINLLDQNVILLFYEYETFRSAENWTPTDLSFLELHRLVASRTRHVEAGSARKEASGLWSWLFTLYLLVQLKCFFEMIIWLFKSLRLNRRVTLEAGNTVAVLLVDVALGCLLLSLLDVRSQHYSELIMDYIEVMVSQLRSLLKWLMGAPAGLKLNTAFTNMLGKFFLYHINLWWMFLDLTKSGLQLVSQMYYWLGFLGVTFQAALVSDMISFITFHAYCIYVYIARLFNIQVSGLVALLRLFVGRKRNPLRGAIDSCEYSNQELFVGTVAFTILLFLLPTTAVYYIVFTLLRLLSLGVKGALFRLCHCVRTLPLYVCILYLIKSPRVAGNIHMEVLRYKSPHRALVLSVRLMSRPLGALVSRPPPVAPLAELRWTPVLSNIIRGKLLES